MADDFGESEILDVRPPATEATHPQISPFNGYIDFCGYHSLSGGWFFVGWMTHCDADKLARNVVAHFADVEISGHASILSFFRGDVGDQGIGFLLFLHASSATKSTFGHLSMEIGGASRVLYPVGRAYQLPESQLAPVLDGVLASNQGNSQYQKMKLLAAGGVDPADHGCIEYYGYHALAGGWFISGWLHQSWEKGRAPEQVSISFADDDVLGEAFVTPYARPDLQEGVQGIVLFVQSAAVASGPLRSVSFHIDGLGFILRPIQAVPQLREIELTARLKANLVRAKQSLPHDRMLNLLGRRAYSGEDTLDTLKPAVFLYIDEAILCGPDGIILIGWMLAKPNEVRHIRLRCGDLTSTIDLREAVKIERHDVLAEFARQGFDDADCGFMMFLPRAVEPHERAYLEIETERCQAGYRNIPSPVRTGIAAIKHLLELVNIRFADMQAAYDNVLGPAIEALNQTRLSQSPAEDIVDYGSVPKDPEFSVIVPLYGRLDFIEYQLALFSAYPKCCNIEFIYVLDDPSKRREARFLFASVYERFLVPFRAILLESNVGFAPANNIGLKHAHGTFIAYLNSDVFPGTLDWLERLSRRLIEDPTLGVIGPLLLFEDGSVQHRGMYFERLPEFGNWFFCQHYDKGMRYSGTRDVQRSIGITGACMVLRRELANRIGGFDEAYVIGDFEDSDLCLKLQALDLGCGVDPNVRLFHLERKSQSLSGGNWRVNLTAYNAWQHDRRWGKMIEQKQSLEPGDPP